MITAGASVRRVSDPCSFCYSTTHVLAFTTSPTVSALTAYLCIPCLMDIVDSAYSTSFARSVIVGLSNRATGMAVPPRRRPKAHRRTRPDREALT